ncbi:PIR protein, putative [Plasmodium sp. gorilla clade G1]|nr:PIR protein, putative [Plasmodium sp. gorilla clade G1]
MKLNYTKIFLFSLSLNILLLSSQVYNQRNHYITYHISNTKPIKAHRSLCECELYMTNYDNDPEMKAVMQDFDRQTSQRFEEYNERIIKNQQKCIEQCEKDIQKIILKDKIEKELTEKLSTLQTDISTDDIPTCVCEKSLADKTEKLCLKCGYGIGSNVPLVGIINGVSFYASVLKYAVNCGITKEAETVISKGMEMATQLLTERISGLQALLKSNLADIVAKNSNTPMLLSQAIEDAIGNACDATMVNSSPKPLICGSTSVKFPYLNQTVAQVAVDASKAGKLAGAEAAKTAEQTAWNSAFTWETFFSSSLGISIIVTVCVVLMLIIIYLILRYRRRKKMNKKLQYIKLLKE